MRRIALFIAALISAAALLSAAVTAGSVLDKTLSALDDSPAIEAMYGIASSGESSHGVIVISGDKFLIRGDGATIWFDGTTQWSYTERTGEVNVTEPTAEEIAEVNPLAILRSEPDVYRLKLKKQGKSGYVIELTDQSGDLSISKATVTISADDFLPANAIVETASGDKFSLVLKNIKKLKTVDPQLFRFNPKDYPGVEVIDLR